MNLFREFGLSGFFGIAFVICLSLDASAQGFIPRFEMANCAFPIPKDEIVVCGYVVVPENRSKRNSSTIRLPIIIQKSNSPNPKPDPVLRTLGGPGGSSLKLVRGRRSSPWLRDRDVIIFEQRGTKYAQPALECPEVDDANISSAERQLNSKTARTNELKAAKACHARLIADGIDLGGYNSRESAADIEDVRRVLKLDKINLYGVSYGSRLMLNVIRDFPDGIRSVVLESTLPPEVNYDEVGVDGIVHALNALFANCLADTDCAQAYPDLEREFFSTVARLNRQPYTALPRDPKTQQAIEIQLNGDDFATWIVDYFLSNEPSAIADAPMIIHQVFGGKYDVFGRYAADKITPGFY